MFEKSPLAYAKEYVKSFRFSEAEKYTEDFAKNAYITGFYESGKEWEKEYRRQFVEEAILWLREELSMGCHPQGVESLLMGFREEMLKNINKSKMEVNNEETDRSRPDEVGKEECN